MPCFIPPCPVPQLHAPIGASPFLEFDNLDTMNIAEEAKRLMYSLEEGSQGGAAGDAGGITLTPHAGLPMSSALGESFGRDTHASACLGSCEMF